MADSSRTPLLPSTPPPNTVIDDSQPPPLPIDIDVIFSVIRSTFLNPLFALFVPLTVLSTDPRLDATPFLWSCAYSGAVILGGIWNHLNRIHDSHLSLFSFRQKHIDWNDQIVLITGGASGIGLLLAQTLAMRNVTVVAMDIKPVESEFENIHGYVCDVSNYESVQAVAEKIRQEVGHPTAIVNNAGVVSGKLILDLTPLDIQRTYGVNVLSHYWTIKAFLPAMIERGQGHIVTVGSVLGLMGAAQMTDYCASKSALLCLHDSLRFELDNRYDAKGVRTTLILPGHIHTPLFAKIRFPRSAIFRFFAPSLVPQTVVKNIITALDVQENRVVRIPAYTHSARILSLGSSLVPGFIRSFAQWITNADFSMEAYGPQGEERVLCKR